MKRIRNNQLFRNACALLLRLYRSAFLHGDLEASLRLIVQLSMEAAWLLFWLLVPICLILGFFHRNGFVFAAAFAFLGMIWRSLNDQYKEVCNR